MWNRKTCACVVVLLCVATGALSWLLALSPCLPKERTALILTWVEVVGGTMPGDMKTYATCGSGVFGLMLTAKLYMVALLFAGIPGIFYQQITRERRQAMKLIDVLKIRDAAVNAAIMRRMQQEEFSQETIASVSDILDSSVREGARDWANKDLPNLFGQETAERYLNMLDQE